MCKIGSENGLNRAHQFYFFDKEGREIALFTVSKCERMIGKCFGNVLEEGIESESEI